MYDIWIRVCVCVCGVVGWGEFEVKDYLGNLENHHYVGDKRVGMFVEVWGQEVEKKYVLQRIWCLRIKICS